MNHYQPPTSPFLCHFLMFRSRFSCREIRSQERDRKPRVDWKPRVTVTFQRNEPVLQGAPVWGTRSLGNLGGLWILWQDPTCFDASNGVFDASKNPETSPDFSKNEDLTTHPEMSYLTSSVVPGRPTFFVYLKPAIGCHPVLSQWPGFFEYPLWDNPPCFLVSSEIPSNFESTQLLQSSKSSINRVPNHIFSQRKNLKKSRQVQSPRSQEDGPVRDEKTMEAFLGPELLSFKNWQFYG